MWFHLLSDQKILKGINIVYLVPRFSPKRLCNSVWHDLGKQEKFSSLEPPKAKRTTFITLIEPGRVSK